MKFMWKNGAETWEDSLGGGTVVPLYKGKGDRNNPNNYRGVCLLSMGSMMSMQSMPGMLIIMILSVLNIMCIPIMISTSFGRDQVGIKID